MCASSRVDGLNQEISAAMSKDLKKRGFRFVGPTICYAFMQAVGMVDEQQAGCWVAEARS